MTNFVVVDDDITVRSVLARIIDQYNLGEVCAEADDGTNAEKLILRYKPDIAIIDLLLPGQDGISVIKKVKALNAKSVFVMLSQVSDKDMIASAYECGIEFFISKPINVIEVVNVIKKVKEYLALKKTFEAIESAALTLGWKDTRRTANKTDNFRRIINNVMADLGILGELGGNDILNICIMVLENNVLSERLEEIQLNELLKMLRDKYISENHSFTSDVKAIEMRMRRAVAKAIKNIAAMGIEDFSSEKFNMYNSSLFDYTDIKSEMDYLRGRSKYGGKVNIKSFIRRLIAFAEQLA